jgi:hypothetical protein
MPPARDTPRPPPPPQIDRRVRLYRWQWVGLPLLLLVPVLALFGVFGNTRAAVANAGGPLAIDVEYPTRFRFSETQDMYVRVANRSAIPLDTVTVAFDTGYMSGFAAPTFRPDIARAYEVELTHLKPGETRLITVELKGKEYWSREGRIAAWHTGPDTVSVAVSTLIFP